MKTEGNHEGATADAVSYTHLDVYKRQPSVRANPETGQTTGAPAETPAKTKMTKRTHHSAQPPQSKPLHAIQTNPATIGGVPGVYLSYPFCAQKCTYCNFASGVFPRALEERYLLALAAEIRAHEWQLSLIHI